MNEVQRVKRQTFNSHTPPKFRNELNCLVLSRCHYLRSPRINRFHSHRLLSFKSLTFDRCHISYLQPSRKCIAISSPRVKIRRAEDVNCSSLVQDDAVSDCLR
ncbi:hypothetical protein TNCV_1041751 [Trichonephila clavipes]|nr:hypothetical protein TNCV_1041751 [Trichonephila clavipes]